MSQHIAGVLDRRRNRRTLTLGQKAFGMMGTAAIVLTAAVVVADTSSAQTLTRDGFSSTGTWAWHNDSSLGSTDSVDQFAQAQVSGLRDAGHDAGFLMRYASRRNKILVAVSGTGWRIEPQGGSISTGRFAHGASGSFRVEVLGQVVRVLWNGQTIATRQLQGSYPGKHVVATMWQSSPTVQMSGLQAGSLGESTSTSSSPGSSGSPSPTTSDRPPGTATGPTTDSSTPTAPRPPTDAATGGALTGPSAQAGTPTPPTPPTSATPVGAGSGSGSGSETWLSGASGDQMASGGFDGWRSTPAGIAGVWDDGNSSIQQELYSICGGQYTAAKWNRPLDLAMGGIFQSEGESWSAAANGAYDSRWSAVLTKMKSCWGQRPASKLFVRFAHEMNLSSSNWKVRSGEEGGFVKAITRFSDLRYKIFPGMQLVLCPNDGSSGGMADVRALWPGKDSQGRQVADVYAVDSYNMWPHAASTTAFTTKVNSTDGNGAPLGIEKHRQFAESKGVPFAIGEWSNNADPGDGDGGGESPEYVQDFYAWAKSHSGDPDHPRAGQLEYDVLFNLWKQYELWPSTIQSQTAATYRGLSWGR